MTDEGAEQAQPERPIERWSRRYPPLATLVAALILMVAVMPSALNLPQANPSTVLEYAPVPPDGDEAPTDGGSVDRLGLGSSRALFRSGGDPGRDEGNGGAGSGRTPITKRCVHHADGLRQTEDPNAPPCVAFFDGDNGGATYQGVAAGEITVLLYTSTVPMAGGERGFERPPAAGSYCDVDKPANTQAGCLRDDGSGEDYRPVRLARAMSRFFNERFQTYGRRVHMWVYHSSDSQSPSTRRSDAHDNWDRLRPFAVIDDATRGGFNAVYTEAAAKRRVSVYGNYSALANRFYRANAPYVWSFWPDVERWAEQFVGYTCARVAPFKVTHSGNASDAGKARRYGLLSTDDPGFDGHRQFADMVTDRLRDGCGGRRLAIANTYTFPRHTWANDTHPDAIAKARENVARMQADGVTTVLWLGGYETEHGRAMREAEWYPEIIMAGDLLNDEIEETRAQDQQAFRNARIMSNHLREDREEDAPCRQAYRESEPFGSGDDEDAACAYYRPFFMLYRAIQVAGPFLTPHSVDAGNHSIPRQDSTSPFVAACFFGPGDYSCVKDAQESWWDPDAPDPAGNAGQQGCWRMVDDGARSPADGWSRAQGGFVDPGDVCNNVTSGSTLVNPFGPAA